MKLHSLILQRLPGFKFRPLNFPQFREGLNIIVGPNGSGKTSACLAVRELLWPLSVKGYGAISAHSEWSHGDDQFTIALDEGMRQVSAHGSAYIDQLPNENLAACFSMTIDELFDSRDQPFSKRIAQEMAGGYDLQGAQQQIIPTTSAKGALSDWKRAHTALSLYRNDHDALSIESKRELPRIEQQLADAHAADRQAQRLMQIIAAKEAMLEITTLRLEIESFPSLLQTGQIHPSDWNNYQQLCDHREQLNGELSALCERMDQLYIPPDAAIPPTAQSELDRQLSRIARLQQWHADKEQLQCSVMALQSRCQALQQLLGIDDEQQLTELKAADLDTLEELWLKFEALSSKISLLNEQICLYTPEMALPSEPLGHAVQLLAERMSRAHFPAMRIFWLSLLALLIAIDWPHIRDWSTWSDLLPLLSFIPIGYLGIYASTHRRHLKTLEARSRELSLPAELLSHKASLETQLKEAIAAWGKAKQEEWQQLRQRELQIQLVPLLQKQQQTQQQLQEAADAIGISTLPACRYRFAEMIKKLHDSYLQLTDARQHLVYAQQRFTSEWELWIPFAEQCGAPLLANVYELNSAHSAIVERLKRQEEWELRNRDLTAKEQQLAALNSKIELLLQRTGCTQHPELLESLVQQLAEYNQAHQSLMHREKQFLQLSQGFTAEEMLQIDSPVDSLRAEQHSAEACAQQMAILAERRGSLKAKINHMEKSPQGLQLQHAHSAAFARLQETARDAVRRQLTQLLVDDVHHSFRKDCQPVVLQSAASWFSRFTQYGYTLEAPLAHGNEVTYEAVENSTRERKTIDMLSRGTRMQLLIAVRLAFAFEGEKGKLPLPIFLDELLATSDPVRFNAIVEVVTELVKEGRQVFYLTSQPTDLQCWQQHCPDAHIVDIPTLQGQQEFIRAPVLPPKVWSYSEPSCSDVHAYAMSLKLPALQFDLPLAMAPVHYLIDNVSDLHRLLNSGIHTYGQLQMMTDDLLAASVPSSVAAIMQRRPLLEAFFALKSQGRGKPLTRIALSEGGITKAFIDRLWELALEVHCDSKAFLTTLEEKKDERAKRFSKASLEQLKAFLTTHGYLDERPLLTDGEICRKLLPRTTQAEELHFLQTLL